MSRHPAECQNIIATICDGIGECPLFGRGSRWVKEPGFPEDEYLDQCSSYLKFNCTSKEYNIPVLFEGVTPHTSGVVSLCNVSFKAVSRWQGLDLDPYGT